MAAKKHLEDAKKQLTRLTDEPLAPPPTSLSQRREQSTENIYFDKSKNKLAQDYWSKIIFTYEPNIQKFYVLANSTILKIRLSPELAYILGYKNEQIGHGKWADFMPDVSGEIRQLYVYTNIIEQSIVGNQKAPILRVVNVVGEHGQIQEAIYSTEFHFKLQTKRISEIRIEIRSSTGKPVKFQWGNTIAILHFKRSLFA
jgi:hypothetical protein